MCEFPRFCTEIISPAIGIVLALKSVCIQTKV